MKKFLLIVPLLGMLWSCKKQDDTIQKNAQKSANTLQTNSSGDGAYDLLGFGYDVTKEFANSNSSKAQVLNIAALDLQNPGRVIPGNNKTQYGQASYGESAQSLSSSISTKLTATSGLAVFKSTLNLSYSSTDAFSSKYIYGSYNLIVQQKSWKLNADNSILQNYLSPVFLQDLQNPGMTAAQLVSNYGTHVLSNIILGGKLQVMFQSQTSSTSRSVAASAGLQAGIGSLFNLNANLDANQTNASSNFSQTFSYVTHGGDPSKGLVGQITFNQSTPTINIADWQNSCNPQNAELIDIDKDGLIPLYDLIPDAYGALKAAVRSYITQYLIDNQTQVLPAEIYEFSNGSINKHAYNTNPNMGNIAIGYKIIATPFKGYYAPYPGTVPVYQFYNPSNLDHVLTTNRNPGWAGYNYDGIIFYTPLASTPGAVPVYEFTYPTGDHVYNPDLHAIDPFPGWKYNGQPFYVFPK